MRVCHCETVVIIALVFSDALAMLLFDRFVQKAPN